MWRGGRVASTRGDCEHARGFPMPSVAPFFFLRDRFCSWNRGKKKIKKKNQPPRICLKLVV